MTSVFEIYHKTAGFFHHCTPTHMTDPMTYPLTTSHISLKIPSVFKPSHNNMVRSAEELFAVERMATRGFGNKKIATAPGVPVSTTQRWLQRLRSDGDMSSVSLVCGSMAVMRRAFVPQRSSTPGFLLTHAAQSPVFANVCRRLASSAAAAASMSTCRRSTGQRSR